MATYRELIWALRDLVNGGRSNRAITYEDPIIANWIRYWRNYLVSNNIKKYNEVQQGYLQDLGCLQLTKADKAMCSANCWGENVYYVELPEVLDLPNNMGVYYFGLIDKQTRIPLSDHNYGALNKYRRFVPKGELWAEKIRNTVYVHGVDDIFPLGAVNAQVVLSDPANPIICSTGQPLFCFDWDTDCYPIPPGLESALFDLILEKEVGIARAVKPAPDNSDNEVETATL